MTNNYSFIVYDISKTWTQKFFQNIKTKCVKTNEYRICRHINWSFIDMFKIQLTKEKKNRIYYTIKHVRFPYDFNRFRSSARAHTRLATILSRWQERKLIQSLGHGIYGCGLTNIQSKPSFLHQEELDEPTSQVCSAGTTSRPSKHWCTFSFRLEFKF